MKSAFRSVLIAAAAFGALAVSSLAQAQAQPAAAPTRPPFVRQIPSRKSEIVLSWVRAAKQRLHKFSVDSLSRMTTRIIYMY